MSEMNAIFFPVLTDNESNGNAHIVSHNIFLQSLKTTPPQGDNIYCFLLMSGGRYIAHAYIVDDILYHIHCPRMDYPLFFECVRRWYKKSYRYKANDTECPPIGSKQEDNYYHIPGDRQIVDAPIIVHSF